MIRKRPNIMKPFSIAVLALVWGCGGRTDNPPPGPAPSATTPTIGYKPYTLELTGPTFKESELIVVALGDLEYTSLSFDLSAQAKEIRAADLSQHPEIPPRNVRNTLGGLYPDRPYGQVMNENFLTGRIDARPGCSRETMAERTARLNTTLYPYQTVRLGKVRLDLTHQSPSPLVSEKSSLCFATHGKAGWTWHFEPQNFVVDKPGRFRVDGYSHVELQINEEGVDQLVLMSQGSISDITKITYEALPQ